MAKSVVVWTLSGTGEWGHRDGEGNAAQFAGPWGVAVDGGGNDIAAGSGVHPGGYWQGHRDGEGNTAQFNYPCGVAVDREGNVFVADLGNDRIRKISPQGVVSTLAGTGVAGFRDSIASAQFNRPWGVAVDWEGNVFVGDSNNHCIRKISPQGLVSTLAGTGVAAHRDGEGNAGAQFNHPYGVAVDWEGNVIVADTSNLRIRKISTQGIVSTLSGTGKKGFRDGEGNAARFNRPFGVAVDGGGN
eukprot:86475-Pyramimonas_sp.AAC.1